jgi:hypothetical protein
MKFIITQLIGSFDTHTKSFSGRKLSAFFILILVGYLHRYADMTNVIEFVMVDYGAMLVCLGLVTSEKFMSPKKATQESEPTQPSQ